MMAEAPPPAGRGKGRLGEGGMAGTPRASGAGRDGAGRDGAELAPGGPG